MFRLAALCIIGFLSVISCSQQYISRDDVIGVYEASYADAAASIYIHEDGSYDYNLKNGKESESKSYTGKWTYEGYDNSCAELTLYAYQDFLFAPTTKLLRYPPNFERTRSITPKCIERSVFGVLRFPIATDTGLYFAN